MYVDEANRLDHRNFREGAHELGYEPASIISAFTRSFHLLTYYVPIYVHAFPTCLIGITRFVIIYFNNRRKIERTFPGEDWRARTSRWKEIVATISSTNREGGRIEVLNIVVFFLCRSTYLLGHHQVELSRPPRHCFICKIARFSYVNVWLALL